MLSEKEITLGRNTWDLIAPVTQEMGIQFYEHLFETSPELKPLFKTNPKDQAMKLMFMLSYFVHRLDKENDLRAEIKKLAQRQSGYGAKPEHYKLIRDTLLCSMQNDLRKPWNKETESSCQ